MGNTLNSEIMAESESESENITKKESEWGPSQKKIKRAERINYFNNLTQEQKEEKQFIDFYDSVKELDKHTKHYYNTVKNFEDHRLLILKKTKELGLKIVVNRELDVAFQYKIHEQLTPMIKEWYRLREISSSVADNINKLVRLYYYSRRKFIVKYGRDTNKFLHSFQQISPYDTIDSSVYYTWHSPPSRNYENH